MVDVSVTITTETSQCADLGWDDSGGEFNWISSSRSSSSSLVITTAHCPSLLLILRLWRWFNTNYQGWEDLASPHTRHSIHPTVNRDDLLEKVTVKLAVRTHLFGKKKIDSTFLFWSWSGYNQTVAGVPQFSFCYKSDVLGQWSTNTTASSSSHPTPSYKTGHVPRASSETIFQCWGNEQTLVWRCILNLSHPAPEFIRNKLIISNNNAIVHYIIIISNATHLCPRCFILGFICPASCLMSYKINARTQPGPEHRHQWKNSVALTVLFSNGHIRLCNTSSQ